MRFDSMNVQSAVFLSAILALGSAGANGSASELGSGWLPAKSAVEAQAMEQVVGGQYPVVFAVVLRAMCFQCALDLTANSAIDWVALAQCVVICKIAF